MNSSQANPIVKRPRRFERLVLTGFMGSGKTTVGRLLAGHLGWAFLDLDTAIEESAGRSVPAIFAESGEPAFRRLEALALAAALRDTHLVLALGGGAPETAGNRSLLSSTPGTAIVYLAAPFSTLIARCQLQAEEPHAVARPVFADPAHAQQRYMRRTALYEALATHTVSTQERSAAETLHAVLAALEFPPHPADS